MSTSREAFEAWAQKNWMYINAKEDAFAIWQAAMQHAYADAAELCRVVDLHDRDRLKNSDPRVTCAQAIRERAKEVGK